MNFFWKNKKVLIFGLGVLGGGVGVTKFFAKNGAKVTVTDLKNKKELQPSIAKLKQFDIRYVFGGHSEADFRSHDLIVRNPAVPTDSPFAKIAKAAGIPIEMEASLFFMLTPTKKIIGITGTKGKTTTTLLIAKILQQAKFKTVIAGTPQHSMLAQLEKITPDTWVVLELSSWQLESLASHQISPHIAVLTNIFPDHLNRYRTIEDYISAKKIIFQFQGKNDFFITSADWQITKKLAIEAKSQVVFFSKDTIHPNLAKSIRLKGNHNLANFGAAYKVAKVLGISDDIIGKTLENFEGIPDHLEDIEKINGITFINDTTATIPDATIAALNTFDAPIILICGGSDKNLDFSEFTKVVNRKAKAVVLLEGTATDKIEKGLYARKILGRLSDFEKAVRVAFQAASLGDVILLSPGAASFGMFKNEFDRGEQFKRIVRDLAN